jgi:hypothetical protein
LIKRLMRKFFAQKSNRLNFSNAVSEAFTETFKEMGYKINSKNKG